MSNNGNALFEECHQLGADLEERWNDENFASIALEHLKQSTAMLNFCVNDLLADVLRAKKFPDQSKHKIAFGEPSILLYWGENIHIHVSLWFCSTTNIHNHAFSGAFKILKGHSLRKSYDFESSARLAQELLFGRLIRKNVELLCAGDVREIGGIGDIHSVEQLSYPTATLVVRNHRDAEHKGGQHSYLHSGVAFLPTGAGSKVSTLMRLLGAARREGTLDIFEAINLISKQLSLAELGSGLLTHHHLFDFDTGFVCELEQAMSDEYGEGGKKIAIGIRELINLDGLLECRQQLRDPARRLVLALSDTDNAGDYLEVIGNGCAKNGETTLLKWLNDLSVVCEESQD